jgi:DNA-binding transcriptional MerR regulator
MADEPTTAAPASSSAVGAPAPDADPAPPGAPQLTIDELARRTGMTVRNIRAHQSRGLLPPPDVRGRTGYYGDEHAARIELIRELQADGLNLEAIRRLLEGLAPLDGSAGLAAPEGSSAAAPATATDVLDFTRALRAPYVDEDPDVVLQRAGRELARLGIAPETALAVLDDLRRHAEGVATTFVDLFVKEVWEPFDRAGRPAADWPKVRDALERLRSLASAALLAVFQTTMSAATEKATEQTLQRL